MDRQECLSHRTVKNPGEISGTDIPVCGFFQIFHRLLGRTAVTCRGDAEILRPRALAEKFGSWFCVVILAT
jgi:hypothetical protein